MAPKAPNIIVQKDAQKQALSGEPIICGLVTFENLFFGIFGARFAPPGGPNLDLQILEVQNGSWRGKSGPQNPEKNFFWKALGQKW